MRFEQYFTSGSLVFLAFRLVSCGTLKHYPNSARSRNGIRSSSPPVR